MVVVVVVVVVVVGSGTEMDEIVAGVLATTKALREQRANQAEYKLLIQ